MPINLNPFSTKSKELNLQKEQIDLKKQELQQNNESMDKELAVSPADPNEFAMDGGKAELIRWQQDLSPDLQIMANRLRNYYRDEDGNWKPKLIYGKPMAPLCNEECIGELIALLDPTVGRNLIMSKYDRDFIRQKLEDLANTITLLLIADRKRFKIRMSDLTPIVRICQGTFEPAHYRALGGNEKQYVGSSHKFLHTDVEKGEDDKKKQKAWF